MTSLFELYNSSHAPLSPQNLCWNMYGAGIEGIGRNGKPEKCSFPLPDLNQLLVRVDAVSLCLSDIKLIQQGGKHPKLYNRNLAVEPTRLGHEVALTIIQVGERLQSQYSPGQRLALQPDIYKSGFSTAYGYTIPGGLIRFHLIGDDIMDGDEGSYIIPLEGELGYAEAALTEPWACVVAAYTQRRRLVPKPGGIMWILGRHGDPINYQFSSGLDSPNTIVTTDLSPQLLKLVKHNLASRGGTLITLDGYSPANYLQLKQEFVNGFDDIVFLDPRSAKEISTAASLIARRGTFNMVGRTPLDGDPLIDVGRIHYDYTAYLSTTGPDISAAYGEKRNRCELCPGGTSVFVGAGGPMGQMHIQRTIEMLNGPSTILTTDINPLRLNVLHARFSQLALKHDKRFIVSNSHEETLHDFVMHETQNRGANDIVVCVPSAGVMADAASVMTPDGMLMLFAGVPIGTNAPLNLSTVYLHNAQYTGTSGSSIADQSSIIFATQSGELSPRMSIAAIGGMEAAHDGIRALLEGRFPGKILIFPQLTGLPLVGLPELKTFAPHVADYLDDDGSWTKQAESVLIELFWKP